MCTPCQVIVQALLVASLLIAANGTAWRQLVGTRFGLVDVTLSIIYTPPCNPRIHWLHSQHSALRHGLSDAPTLKIVPCQTGISLGNGVKHFDTLLNENVVWRVEGGSCLSLFRLERYPRCWHDLFITFQSTRRHVSTFVYLRGEGVIMFSLHFSTRSLIR